MKNNRKLGKIKDRGSKGKELRSERSKLRESTDIGGMKGKDGLADGGMEGGKDGWMKCV